MLNHHYAVVMAGGPGKRFWPFSRSECPKPFLKLWGEESLLQACYKRLSAVFPVDNIIIIASQRNVDLVREQLPDMPQQNIAAESEGRDSAPCVALGVALVAERDPDALITVVPADQVIHPIDAFADDIRALCSATASEKCIGTIGIPPFEPATRFGYIELGRPVGTFDTKQVFHVSQFREKPSSDKAEAYVASGGYLWNAGVFLAPVGVFEREIVRAAPDIGTVIHECRRLLQQGLQTSEITSRVYKTVQTISIDYAVIEKLDRVLTLKASFTWDDVGDWSALTRYLPADADGNIVRGTFVGINAGGNIVCMEGMKAALLGVDDLVIAQAGSHLLVAKKEKLADLKALVRCVEEDAGRGEE